MQSKNDAKKLQDWFRVKEKLRNKNRVTGIKTGEVWWCGVGENVGVEINGKNATFERPVLVIKKLTRYAFVGIPLTTKNKTGSWYVHFRFHNKDQCAVLSQIKMMSVNRLYRRMGQIDDADMSAIKHGLRLFLFEK